MQAERTYRRGQLAGLPFVLFDADLGTDIAPAHARGRFFGVSRLVAQSGRICSPASFAFLSVTALASGGIIAFFVAETLRKDPGLRVPARTRRSD